MFQTHPYNLEQLLKDVENGKIQLPDFQRGWVWDDARIRGLLASISLSFPIGAVMTLTAGGDINFKTRLVEGVDGEPINPPEQFLLDGQQRLTSLYQTLLSSSPVDTTDNKDKKIQRWYYIDMLQAMNPTPDRENAIIGVPAEKRVTRDFGRETILDLSIPEMEYEHHMMPTQKLLDSRRWMSEYNLYWSKSGRHPWEDVALFIDEFDKSVVDTFVKYALPVINLDKGTSKEAVCTVFEKVNTGGEPLNVFELATASFAADAGSEHFSLREDWEIRRKRLHSFSGVLQSVSGVQFLQGIALLVTQERRRNLSLDGRPDSQLPAIRCTKDAILNLSLDEYISWATKLEIGFIEAAKFLGLQYVFKSWDVPYNTQLVPLAALYVELGRELEPAVAKARLERWYWSGILGEVYGSNVESQFARDLEEIPNFVRHGVEPRLITEASFDPGRLLYLQSRRSAAYKGIYALQMKSGASDWRTGEPLTLATWYDENIDIHHIFPVAWCGQQSPVVPSHLYNSIINKTPVDASTNRIVGGRSPSVYLSRLERDIDTETLDRVLRAHWINPESLWSDNFAEFFVQRGEKVMKLIGEAMGKTMPSGTEVFQNALYQAGLSEPVELKEPVEDYKDFGEEFDPVGDLGFIAEQEAAD